MQILENLKPTNVFYYFEQLCNIPHGSRNTGAISNYCVKFAKENNLQYVQDQMGNVIIKKSASAGYENSPAVIIQGHLDMVCEKDESISQIDMEKDGLCLAIEGDFIHACGTTLGGDDGIAVAFALSVLADKTAKHPPLEVVLTVDEEIGLLGATVIDVSSCDAKMLINIDSEDEGLFFTSCAGGVTASCVLPVEYTQVTAQIIKITVGGLVGGHSGMEIDKNRGNSNKLMARVLYNISKTFKINLASLNGGAKDNAIPLSTTATIAVNPNEKAEIISKISMLEAEIKNELKVSDKNVYIKVEEKGNNNVKALDLTATNNAIMLINSLPNGIQTMSSEVEGLVQSSLNLGILNLNDKNLIASFAVRSSVESLKQEQLERLECLTTALGGKVETKGDYPGWEYNSNSHLRTVFCCVYEKLFSKKPQVKAIHAGLECGIFCGKIKGLDCISFGPDIFDVHTSKERISISSTARAYNLLTSVLEEL